jgi:hypothetical protein
MLSVYTAFNVTNTLIYWYEICYYVYIYKIFMNLTPIYYKVITFNKNWRSNLQQSSRNINNKIIEKVFICEGMGNYGTESVHAPSWK